VQNWNRKNIDGYFEIYIKSDVKKIIRLNKKKIYKNKKNLVGVNLNAEFPKKPDLKVLNLFNKNINELSNEILKYIFKKLN
jgi:adenylylsulfate kinase-like enzyme